jgi:hypothetical protein
MAHTRQTSVSESLDKSGWAVLVACLAILKAGGGARCGAGSGTSEAEVVGGRGGCRDGGC